jgi:glycogen operon protein
MEEDDWHFDAARFLAWTVGPIEPGQPPLLLALNAGDSAIDMILPHWPDLTGWRLQFASIEGAALGERQDAAASYELPPQSVVAFGGVS